MGQLRGDSGPSGSSPCGEAAIRDGPQVDRLTLFCPWWLQGSRNRWRLSNSRECSLLPNEHSVAKSLEEDWRQFTPMSTEIAFAFP